jgi:TRAP-type uncharacterized transport system fused permease subunit
MGTPAQIIQAAATAVFGVFCLSITVEGWFRGQVSLIERALLMVAALGLLHAGGFTDLIGIVIGGAVLIRRLRMPVPTTE